MVDKHTVMVHPKAVPDPEVPEKALRNAYERHPERFKGKIPDRWRCLLKSGSISRHWQVMEGYTKCLRKVSHFH